MKKYLFLILIIVTSCSKEKPQDLLTVFSSKECCHYPVTTKEYVVGDMFCWTSIYVNSDFTYSIEQGCEGNSEITVGTWKAYNDSITFTPLQPEKVDILGNVKWTFSKKSTNKLTLIVKDKEHRPVQDFIIINSNKFEDLLATQEYKRFETNAKGTVTFDYSDYDSLAFPGLLNSDYNILAVGLPDTLEFILDINERAIMYEGFKYSENLMIHALFSTDSTLVDNRMIYKRVKH